MAIDATLVDGDGRELDMGSAFDEMTELSHPELESSHLASGTLGPAQHRHRELLRAALAAGGFRGIANEWWHFELGDRERVRRSFLRID
jgi:D-alanyl-D-alanine dipeptidase